MMHIYRYVHNKPNLPVSMQGLRAAPSQRKYKAASVKLLPQVPSLSVRLWALGSTATEGDMVAENKAPLTSTQTRSS